MKILMVCLGNICRSPMADGLLRKKVATLPYPILVDSAGTANHHVGEAPDKRMQATAKTMGCPIGELRSRQFTVSDFDLFDKIFVMDTSNYENVSRLARHAADRQKVDYLLNVLAPNENKEVPDPYYGGEQGFMDVYRLLDAATDKLIEKITRNEW